MRRKYERRKDISIHAPLAGSDPRCASGSQAIRISIHAPLAGSDSCRAAGRSPARHFNPRSPCGERPTSRRRPPRSPRFQSTLPLRGATRLAHPGGARAPISIHAPLAGSDAHPVCLPYDFHISIHAPLAGSDQNGSSSSSGNSIFQSTLPLRGATLDGIFEAACADNFNPRSPCGERPGRIVVRPFLGRFQSTLPLRGATEMTFAPGMSLGFQSTLPLRGATDAYPAGWEAQPYFNPRSPCGERHAARGW